LSLSIARPRFYRVRAIPRIARRRRRISAGEPSPRQLALQIMVSAVQVARPRPRGPIGGLVSRNDSACGPARSRRAVCRRDRIRRDRLAPARHATAVSSPGLNPEPQRRRRLPDGFRPAPSMHATIFLDGFTRLDSGPVPPPASCSDELLTDVQCVAGGSASPARPLAPPCESWTAAAGSSRPCAASVCERRQSGRFLPTMPAVLSG
jgi:hypothetical protein